jgi:hypothetical protein
MLVVCSGEVKLLKIQVEVVVVVESFGLEPEVGLRLES